MNILLVEDQAHHRAAAAAVLTAAGITYKAFDNESSAIFALQSEGFDGVITDLFVPHANRGEYFHTEDPCGLAVALAAEQLKIPFVICTAGYHHGARYDWVCQIGRLREWPEMVDQSSAGNGEAESKDWEKALAVLQKLINTSK